jgi:hypothetical protein
VRWDIGAGLVSRSIIAVARRCPGFLG